MGAPDRGVSARRVSLSNTDWWYARLYWDESDEWYLPVVVPSERLLERLIDWWMS